MENNNNNKNKITTYKCVRIKGPYQGPHNDNIISCFLQNEKGETIIWHNIPKRKFLNCKVNDLVTGIKFKNDNIDYKKSMPTIVQIYNNIF